MNNSFSLYPNTMKNKNLQSLLNTVANQDATTPDAIENLGQDLAAKLKGGVQNEVEAGLDINFGCPQNTSCGKG